MLKCATPKGIQSEVTIPSTADEQGLMAIFRDQRIEITPVDRYSKIVVLGSFAQADNKCIFPLASKITYLVEKIRIFIIELLRMSIHVGRNRLVASAEERPLIIFMLNRPPSQTPVNGIALPPQLITIEKTSRGDLLMYLLKNRMLTLIKHLMVSLFVLTLTTQAFAKGDKSVNVILDLNPLSFINSSDLDGFTVSNGFFYEEIEGSVSLAPNIKVGINVNTRIADIDLLVGAGSIINGAFSGGFFTGEVSAMFKAGKHFTIGPHFGVIALADTEWDDDNFSEIDLDGNNGIFGGLTFFAGGETVGFKANLDFIDVEYDVINLNPFQTVSSNVLDMSGFWLNLGVHFKF